jgi:hypothetical protein
MLVGVEGNRNCLCTLKIWIGQPFQKLIWRQQSQFKYASSVCSISSSCRNVFTHIRTGIFKGKCTRCFQHCWL